MDHQESDKVNPKQDDDLKREVESELRAGHQTRAEEFREPEPAGDDQPTPTGPENLRTEVARHLGRGIYPVDRDRMLELMRTNHAPDRLIDRVRQLPHGRRWAGLSEVLTDLEAIPPPPPEA